MNESNKVKNYPWHLTIPAAEGNYVPPVAVNLAQIAASSRPAARHRGLPLQVLAAQTDYRVTDYRVTEALCGIAALALYQVHYLTFWLQAGEFDKEDESVRLSI